MAKRSAASAQGGGGATAPLRLCHINLNDKVSRSFGKLGFHLEQPILTTSCHNTISSLLPPSESEQDELREAENNVRTIYVRQHAAK